MTVDEHIGWKQRAGTLGVQVTGHVVTFILAMILVTAWALTSPLFKLGDGVAEAWKRKNVQ